VLPYLGSTLRDAAIRVYAHRVAGGHRDHRDPGRPPASRRAKGAGGGGPNQGCEQSCASSRYAAHNYHDSHRALATGVSVFTWGTPTYTVRFWHGLVTYEQHLTYPGRRHRSSRSGILTNYYENNTSVAKCPMVEAYPVSATVGGLSRGYAYSRGAAETEARRHSRRVLRFSCSPSRCN
jgi:hypothetical protein